MAGVDNVQLRFLDRQQQWHRNWPPEDASLSATAAAVEFRFEQAGFGSRRLLIPLTGQYQEERL